MILLEAAALRLVRVGPIRVALLPFTRAADCLLGHYWRLIGSPDQAKRWHARAEAYFAHGDWPSVAAATRIALAMDSQMRSAYLLRGLAFESAGQVAAARQAFHAGLRINPIDPELLSALAELERAVRSKGVAEHL